MSMKIFVQLFLSCDGVDANWSSRRDFRTALSLAAEGGNLEIVEMLLVKGEANPNKNFGQPLALSCENGHENVVDLLLRQDAIDLRPIIYPKLTPLSAAAKGGHLGIAKLLLDHGQVDPNGAVDPSTRTPFLWAAWMGHTDIVKLLLDYEEVVPDRTYDMDRTPLSWVSLGAEQLYRDDLSTFSYRS